MGDHKLCMCSGPVADDYDIERLTRPKFISTTIVLGLVNVAVIFGNSLVIAAVCTTRKLRTVTNIFIVSLAFADLLLGCIILPFSITNQVLNYWIFGRVMCAGWLAVDVWLSTASIVNLCAISFDRYIAITRPIKYPNVLSARRAKYLTAGVWISAFVICLPPLVGWRDTEKECSLSNDTIDGIPFVPFINLLESNYTSGNASYFSESFMNISLEKTCHRCYCKCTLVDTQGYRIYSAMGSFFVPMFIMVFFYIRIYMAAVKTAASMRRGVLSTKNSDEMSKHESEMAMRIHTGGSRTIRAKPMKNGAPKNKKTEKTSPIGRQKLSFEHDTLQSTRINADLNSANTSRCSNYGNDETGTAHIECDGTEISSDPTQIRRARLIVKGIGRSGILNIKLHHRKFRRESKAAKTLAIIVGAFILCWFPFFTIYLIGAFRDDLISQTLFEVLFWLGYCNSAINPCIYASCARDFRSAFRRILCGLCPEKPANVLKNSTDVIKNTQPANNVKDSESLSDT